MGAKQGLIDELQNQVEYLQTSITELESKIRQNEVALKENSILKYEIDGYKKRINEEKDSNDLGMFSLFDKCLINFY